MDFNDGGKGSGDKRNHSFKYQQFLRLFVSTQSGLKFIVCVDKQAKGQELEYQISETYEQLQHNYSFDQNEELQLRSYRTKNIKHHGYQLAIPRNMTVGHFLEDKAEIECDIEPNTHKELFKVKLEEKKVNEKEKIHSLEPIQKKKQKYNKPPQEEREQDIHELDLPQQMNHISNGSHDSSIDAQALKLNTKNSKSTVEQKQDNQAKLLNISKVSSIQIQKPYQDISSQRSIQNESVRQTPKQQQLVEPHIDIETVDQLRLQSPSNAQKTKSNSNVQHSQNHKPQPNQIQKIQSPQTQIQNRPQVQSVVSQKSHQTQQPQSLKNQIQQVKDKYNLGLLKISRTIRRRKKRILSFLRRRTFQVKLYIPLKTFKRKNRRQIPKKYCQLTIIRQHFLKLMKLIQVAVMKSP